ncbi:MAG: helix-turn-helix domain-containing protein [Verrucomicrobiales bacterium]|nr:helix-turn-helix domain-containing protein [Verrucomicrobiales bacterium]
MPRAAFSSMFGQLMEVAGRLRFRPHRIAHLLDARGRHEVTLPSAFPFLVSLFRLRTGAVTRQLTWHQRLELLMPLDGPLKERMGETTVVLQPGDLLVVDHLKPHQVVEDPGLDTRVVVLTFLQEWVFAPGSPPSDFAFLAPFYRKSDGQPLVLRRAAPGAEEAHGALARLLDSYFGRSGAWREAGCKAWLLVLLHALSRAAGDGEVDRGAILRRQEIASRLQPVLNHVRENYAERLSLGRAAALCGMSAGRFGRVFKQVCGMTLVAYVHQVRMARAVEALRHSTEPIATIASRLGFSDQSHFDRCFRRGFGCSPSQYRRGPGTAG